MYFIAYITGGKILMPGTIQDVNHVNIYMPFWSMLPLPTADVRRVRGWNDKLKPKKGMKTWKKKTWSNHKS